MLIPQTLLLRARPLTAIARNTSSLQPIHRGHCLSTYVLPQRSFSVSHNHRADDTNKTCSPNPLFHSDICLATATTTWEYISVKPGTPFNYFKILPHLVPRGWTNDPKELQDLMRLRIHKKYIDFPPSCSAILFYRGTGGWWAHLLKAHDKTHDKTYVYTATSQLFLLKTSIELPQLLGCMSDQNDSVTLNQYKLLEHPKLDWYELGENEWTDSRKAYYGVLNVADDELRRSANERAMLKCTRKEYVDWVGLMANYRVETRWETAEEMIQQNNCLLRAAAWDGRKKLKMTWKEYTDLWVVMEKDKAGKEYDAAVAKTQAPREFS